MTAVTQSTITKEQSIRGSLDRGVASLAAVCDGLFEGRTCRRAAVLAMASESVYLSTYIGNREAA
jgi:hypothetical protein